MSRACVALIQQGARRNYVYACQLEDAGLLHSLVTDTAWAASERNVARRLTLRVAPRRIAAIDRRTIHGVPPEKVRSSSWPNVVSALASPFVHEERRYAIADEALARRFAGAFDGATVVVNYHGNGGSLLDRAKSRGARVVTDFVVTPKYLEIEQAERQRWPGWERCTASPDVIAFYRRRMSWLVQISDLYFCPAPSVARDLAEIPGFDPSRVRLVPYGISGVLRWQPMPVRGRVLFVGAAGLRKGLPYLAEAARVLKGRRPEIEIVVAGHASPEIRQRPETRDLQFLGVLGREVMADEFARADVFCLPSLAEGSATSIFEALAYGIPVITTASSGSFVSDGVEGVVVPERDAEAIASSIERIVEDRELRARMSTAALALAARYDDAQCGRRFISEVHDLVGQG